MKRHLSRLLIPLALVAAASFIAAPGALATTVSPTGNVTATSSSTSFNDTNAGQRVNCTASTIVDNLAASGSSTIALGNASFTGCTNALLGTFVVTQKAAWTNSITYTAGSPNTANLSITVPTGGVELRSSVCDFTAGGTVRANPVTSSSSPVPVKTITLSAATGLKVNTVISGCLGVINPGDNATFTATYALNHTVFVGP